MLQADLLFHDSAQALQLLCLLGGGVLLAALVEHVERQGCQAGEYGVLGCTGPELQHDIDYWQPSGFDELHGCAAIRCPRLHVGINGFEEVQINPQGRHQTTMKRAVCSGV
ncbi:hypothetical protein D3C81_1217760 [compost metagenome]